MEEGTEQSEYLMRVKKLSWDGFCWFLDFPLSADNNESSNNIIYYVNLKQTQGTLCDRAGLDHSPHNPPLRT